MATTLKTVGISCVDCQEWTADELDPKPREVHSARKARAWSFIGLVLNFAALLYFQLSTWPAFQEVAWWTASLAFTVLGTVLVNACLVLKKAAQEKTWCFSLDEKDTLHCHPLAHEGILGSGRRTCEIRDGNKTLEIVDRPDGTPLLIITFSGRQAPSARFHPVYCNIAITIDRWYMMRIRHNFSQVAEELVLPLVWPSSEKVAQLYTDNICRALKLVPLVKPDLHITRLLDKGLAQHQRDQADSQLANSIRVSAP